MSVFVLTWNPDSSTGDQELIEQTSAGFAVEDRWSVGGRTDGIRPGDQAFMLRQRRDRGIVAHGRFTSGVFPDRSWREDSEEGEQANYALVEWDTWLSDEDRLSIEELLAEVPEVNWNYSFQSSGNRLLDAAAPLVTARWDTHLDGLGFSPGGRPEETIQSFHEGDRTTVTVNRYERDPRARADCISHRGTTCAACGFSFGAVYGALGDGFIHVHHIVDLAEAGPDYEVNGEIDLIPLCANCHSMIHRDSTPARSVDDLKQIIASARQP